MPARSRNSTATSGRTSSPRLGVAYDLTGDGKTVVKGTYGIYNTGQGEAFAQRYNQNAVYQAQYRWRDLNRNDNYDPGEVNLDVNGPDFISTTSAANNIFNPDLQRPQQHELTAVFDRELRDNMAARVAYVYKRNVGEVAVYNVLRPYEAYNIPLQRRDPGPDGILNNADDGGTVTIYDYDPAYRGAAFVGNYEFNRPSGRTDFYNTLEFTLNRRMTIAVGREHVVHDDQESSLADRGPGQPERRLLPDRRDLAVGLQGERQLPLPVQHHVLGRVRHPAGRARPAHQRLPRGRPRRRSAAAAAVDGHAAARAVRRAGRTDARHRQPAAVEVPQAAEGRRCS